ncbi:sigma D regulator [Gynuella sp.]|uniref:sigma D regulator n=1 Tax=Gynuella sp. TaxID=2969146 RepID=UPI003D12564A
MLQQITNAKERWGGVNDVIDRWLNERQELLVRFCSIEGLEEFQSTPTSVSSKIQSFFDILIDYVSAGHFEVYEKLLKQADQYNDDGRTLYDRVYPELQKNTQENLDFADKYATEELCRQNRESLSSDLSKLGEALENRFQLEDQLIEQLHEVHREKTA